MKFSKNWWLLSAI